MTSLFVWSTATFDKLFEKATSHLLLEPDWKIIFQICDCIRRGDVKPKYVLSCIKKKLNAENHHVALYTLQVLESCMTICGSPFHAEVLSRPFMEDLKEIVKGTATNENVRSRILELLQIWARSFCNEPKYRVVQDIFNVLKREGYRLQGLEERDAMFIANDAPVWCCYQCRIQFACVQRKHHCRNCGQVFCSKCSSRSCPVRHFNIEKEVRICEACWQELNTFPEAMRSTATGRLLEEPVACKEITWEIYNYYTLSFYSDFALKSPEFSFAGATWRITMMLDKCARNRDIVLHLKRMSSSPLGRIVYCDLTICKDDGTSCGGKGIRTFEDSNRSCYMELFRQSVLFVAPKGVLRVRCKLHVERKSVTAASSQTEVFMMRSGKLSQDLEKLFLNGNDSDVIIRMKGRDFRAHRGILGARSPVFASMFRVDMMEKNSGIVAIDDCDVASFRDFLYFIYTADLPFLSLEKATTLYVLADKYDVAELKSDCLEWMKSSLTMETLFDIVTIALQYSETELLQLATSFFRMNMKIVKTVSWKRFMGENPTAANELLDRVLGDKYE